MAACTLLGWRPLLDTRMAECPRSQVPRLGATRRGCLLARDGDVTAVGAASRAADAKANRLDPRMVNRARADHRTSRTTNNNGNEVPQGRSAPSWRLGEPDVTKDSSINCPPSVQRHMPCYPVHP